MVTGLFLLYYVEGDLWIIINLAHRQQKTIKQQNNNYEARIGNRNSTKIRTRNGRSDSDFIRTVKINFKWASTIIK